MSSPHLSLRMLFSFADRPSSSTASSAASAASAAFAPAPAPPSPSSPAPGAQVRGCGGRVKCQPTDFFVRELRADRSPVYYTSPASSSPLLLPAAPPPPPPVSCVPEAVRAGLSAAPALCRALGAAPVALSADEHDKDQRRALHAALQHLTGLVSTLATGAELSDAQRAHLAAALHLPADDDALRAKRWFVLRQASAGDRRRARVTVPAVRCTLVKVGMDTNRAVTALAERMHTNVRNVSFAGIKDQLAVTVQECVVARVDPALIARVGDGRGVRNVWLGDMTAQPTADAMQIGSHGGNRFSVVVRDVDADAARARLDAWDGTFINYFGEQRFGRGDRLTTATVGRALLRGDPFDAMRLIVLGDSVSVAGGALSGPSVAGGAVSGPSSSSSSAPSSSSSSASSSTTTTPPPSSPGVPDPRVAAEIVARLIARAGTEGKEGAEGVERAGTKRGREEEGEKEGEVWRSVDEATARAELLACRYARGDVERGVVEAVRASPADAEAALRRVPTRLRLLYVNAVQALLWNAAVSARVAWLGLRVVPGDLVLEGQEEEDGDGEDGGVEGGGGDEGAVEGNEGEGKEKEGSANHALPVMSRRHRGAVEYRGHVWRMPKSVRVVTAEDVATERYSVEDVVLPLPGCLVAYPQHCAGLPLYQSLLHHLVDLPESGLTPSPLPHPPPTSAAAAELFDRALHRSSVFGPLGPMRIAGLGNVPGSYRRIVARARDLSWELLRSTPAPTSTPAHPQYEPLFEADVHRTHALPLGAAFEKRDPAQAAALAPSPGHPAALTLTFSLPTSSYATMLLREVMRNE